MHIDSHQILLCTYMLLHSLSGLATKLNITLPFVITTSGEIQKSQPYIYAMYITIVMGI